MSPLQVCTDLAHGGRWTSWRSGRREWLWTNPAVDTDQRERVRPGDDFVDAGGAEECCPTVRGRPDHGDAWSRPWTGTPDAASVALPRLGRLRRQVSHDQGALRIDYRIDGRPRTPLLHALHALLDVGPAAVLDVPEATTAIAFDDLPDQGVPAPRTQRAWPAGLDRLGPDDGTATCVLIPGVHRAVVTDASHTLQLDWTCPSRPDLCSLVLWRNLGGWPADRPYRSIGIEPMIGRAIDLGTADPDDCVLLDDSGGVSWTLRVRASQATDE